MSLVWERRWDSTYQMRLPCPLAPIKIVPGVYNSKWFYFWQRNGSSGPASGMLNQMPLQILLLQISILTLLVTLTLQFSIPHMIHVQLILQSMLNILQLIFKLNRQGYHYATLYLNREDDRREYLSALVGTRNRRFGRRGR